MKYISLLNPITIKYLIDNPNTKYIIINTLKLILNDEDFELLNYFTHEEENVRSYTIFKNKSKIVLMDYNINENKATNKVGIEIIPPYFIKSKNVYFISYFFIKDVNIIPASAPIGVKNAPKLDPIIVEYVAFKSPLLIIDA